MQTDGSKNVNYPVYPVLHKSIEEERNGSQKRLPGKNQKDT